MQNYFFSAETPAILGMQWPLWWYKELATTEPPSLESLFVLDVPIDNLEEASSQTKWMLEEVASGLPDQFSACLGAEQYSELDTNSCTLEPLISISCANLLLQRSFTREPLGDVLDAAFFAVSDHCSKPLALIVQKILGKLYIGNQKSLCPPDFTNLPAFPTISRLADKDSAKKKVASNNTIGFCNCAVTIT